MDLKKKKKNCAYCLNMRCCLDHCCDWDRCQVPLFFDIFFIIWYFYHFSNVFSCFYKYFSAKTAFFAEEHKKTTIILRKKPDYSIYWENLSKKMRKLNKNLRIFLKNPIKMAKNLKKISWKLKKIMRIPRKL